MLCNVKGDEFFLINLLFKKKKCSKIMIEGEKNCLCNLVYIKNRGGQKYTIVP